MTTQQEPSVGRVVFYVLPMGANVGEARRADVVDVLEGHWVCELTVTLSAGDLGRTSDTDPRDTAVLRNVHGDAFFMRVVAEHGDCDQPGTWFWPPRV